MNSRVEISKRLVLMNSASAALARLINVSIVVWLYQFLLRRISPEEYSLLPVLMSIILLLPLVTMILTSGLSRFLVAAYAQGDDRAVTQIVSTMFPLLLAAGFLLLTLGLVFSYYVDRILSIPPGQLWDARLMMFLLTLPIATRLPCSPFTVGLYVRQKLVLYNLINVGDQLFRLFLLFLLLVGIGARVLWVVVANVTAELCLIAVLVVVSRYAVPALRFRVHEIRWGRARELMSFGAWSFLGSVAFQLRQTLVLLTLNRMATPLDVAVYDLGSMPRRQIDAWSDVLGLSLYPVVTSMYAIGATSRLRNIYLRGGRIALWAALAVALPAMIYAQTLIRLYVGNTYLEAGTVILLTLGCLPLANAAWMLWYVANATGRVRATGLRSIVSQSAVVALAFYLAGVLGWGAVGAALASFSVGVVSSIFLLWPLGLRLADVRFGTWIRETLIPGATPGCLAAVVWVTLNVVVRPDSWATLALCTAVGALCYVAVLLVFCLEPADRRDLAEILARARRFLSGRGYLRQDAELTPAALTPSASHPSGAANPSLTTGNVAPIGSSGSQGGACERADA